MRPPAHPFPCRFAPLCVLYAPFCRAVAAKSARKCWDMRESKRGRRSLDGKKGESRLDVYCVRIVCSGRRERRPGWVRTGSCPPTHTPPPGQTAPSRSGTRLMHPFLITVLIRVSAVSVADPDHSFHFVVDPDPSFHFDADPDPSIYFDGDPDPSFHFDVVPDHF